MDAWNDADGALLDDRYEVGSVLGRGGAAVVHRAWDRERGREVAVKLLPPGSEPLRPGQQESDILATLDHPQLVALHDVLVTDEGTALVMELVDGPSLHDRLDRGPLDPEEALVVLRDVGAGLAHAHRRGVVHRDVKPGNVLLRLEAGRVVEAKLSDFGIARRADATRTTGERIVVGTVRFLSPEQARGERVTAASDVYSLGLTVLAALTGEDAFPGRETESLAGRLLRPPPVPSSLPEDWADLLRGMTALDPEDRLDASATAALAWALGSGSRPAATVAASGAGATTRPIDVLQAVSVVRARRGSGRMVAAIVGMAAAGAVLGGVIAAVLAPTAVERALSGVLPEAAQPVASAPVTNIPAASPTAAAQAPAAAVAPPPTAAARDVATSSGSSATDDRPAASGEGRSGDDHSGHGSGGGSSGDGSGSSGHGGGHGSDD